jgi:hypothetical protein
LVRINPPALGSTVFPEIVAGDPGRIAIAYMATGTGGDTAVSDNAPAKRAVEQLRLDEHRRPVGIARLPDRHAAASLGAHRHHLHRRHHLRRVDG